MKDKEYFDQANEAFDHSLELQAIVATAQFFIEQMGMEEGQALMQFGLTSKTYHKHKTVSLS